MRHGELLLAIRFYNLCDKTGIFCNTLRSLVTAFSPPPPRSESTVTRNHSNLQNSAQLKHMSYDIDLRPAATRCTSYAFLDDSRPEAETNQEKKP